MPGFAIMFIRRRIFQLKGLHSRSLTFQKQFKKAHKLFTWTASFSADVLASGTLSLLSQSSHSLTPDENCYPTQTILLHHQPY